MAFQHGKAGAVLVRDTGNTWRDLSAFLNDAQTPFKVDTAESTTFQKSAKTYLVGLRDGTVSLKGYWDPTATTGPDVVLAALVGAPPTTGLYGGATSGVAGTVSAMGQLQYGPQGETTGNVRYCMDVILTEYTTDTPVSGIVTFTATFQISNAPTRDTSAFATAGTTT